MTKARINNRIVEWAQLRSGLSDGDLAERFSRVANDEWTKRIANWKAGEDLPTFRQAQQLAKHLRIPFGYLFASEFPVETVRIPDLRTIADERPKAFSIGFVELLLDIQAKQEWYRDELIVADHQPLPYVAKFSIQSDPLEIAREIRDLLHFDDDLRASTSSWEQFLSRACDRVESVGTLVFRSGVVGFNNSRPLSVDEFRGFAIVDEFAPALFINSRDTNAAQTFTLVHEFVHVWIGASGVSNPRLDTLGTYAEASEQTCNAVAAEVLVPRAEILGGWNANVDAVSNAITLSRRFRVSTIVILRRALDLQLIERDEFFEAYNAQMEVFRRRQSREGGGNFANLMGARTR